MRIHSIFEEGDRDTPRGHLQAKALEGDAEHMEMLGQDQQAGLARQAAAEKRRHAAELMAAAAALANSNAPKASAPSGDVGVGAHVGPRGPPTAVPEDLEDPFGSSIPNWLSGDDSRPPQAKPKAVRTASGPDPFPWDQFADGNAEQNLDLLVAWSSSNTSRTSASAYSDDTAALEDPETDFQAEPWVEAPSERSRPFALVAPGETPLAKSRRKKPRLSEPGASASATEGASAEKSENADTPGLGKGGAATRSDAPAWPLSDTFSFERLENAAGEPEAVTPVSPESGRRDALKDALADLQAAWGDGESRCPSLRIRNPCESLPPGCAESTTLGDYEDGDCCTEERHASTLEKKILPNSRSPGSAFCEGSEAAAGSSQASPQAARGTQRPHLNASPRDKSKARHLQGSRSPPRHRVHFRSSICENGGQTSIENPSHDHESPGFQAGLDVSPTGILSYPPEVGGPRGGHVDLQWEARAAGSPRHSAATARHGDRPGDAHAESFSCSPTGSHDLQVDALPHTFHALTEINGNAPYIARSCAAETLCHSPSQKRGDSCGRAWASHGRGEQENILCSTPMFPAGDRPHVTWTLEDRRLLQKARARRQAQQTRHHSLSRHSNCSPLRQNGSVSQDNSQRTLGAPRAYACQGRRSEYADANEPTTIGNSVLATSDRAALWGRMGKASGEIERLILFAEVRPSQGLYIINLFIYFIIFCAQQISPLLDFP